MENRLIFDNLDRSTVSQETVPSASVTPESQEATETKQVDAIVADFQRRLMELENKPESSPETENIVSEKKEVVIPDNLKTLLNDSLEQKIEGSLGSRNYLKAMLLMLDGENNSEEILKKAVDSAKGLKDVELASRVISILLENNGIKDENEKQKATTLILQFSNSKLSYTDSKEEIRENGNDEQRQVLFNAELRDVYMNLKYSDNGKIVNPLEGALQTFLDFKASGENEEFLSKTNRIQQHLLGAIYIKYFPNHITGLDYLNLDPDKLKKATDILSKFQDLKVKETTRVSMNKIKRLKTQADQLTYQRQIGEIGIFEFNKQYGLLIEEAKSLTDKDPSLKERLNLSQNRFMALFAASPAISLMGDAKDRIGNNISNKWKTFWLTREKRRSMLKKGAWEAIKFPFRHIPKIPLTLLGYRWAINRIRRKFKLEPKTIMSDLRSDFSKLGKGFENFAGASKVAKAEVKRDNKFISRFDKVKPYEVDKQIKSLQAAEAVRPMFLKSDFETLN